MRGIFLIGRLVGSVHAGCSIEIIASVAFLMPGSGALDTE